MPLNANYILAGQQVDPVGAIGRGAQVGQQVNEFRNTNALRQMYRERGADILRGDENALAALAQFSPQEALGVQTARLGQDRTRLDMQATQQRMDMLSREEQRQVQAHAASLTAAEREAEAARIEQAVAAGLQAQTPQQWDAMMQQTAPDLVGQFDNREVIAGRFMSVAESLKRFDERNAVPEAPETPAAIRALEFRAEQAGLERGTPEYQQFMLEGGRSSDQLRIETTADGRTIVTQGAVGAYDGGIQPSSPTAMINSIEGILNDPALDASTGMFSFLQAIPGTPQRAFGARARQLEGQAFLQAFESLKGGGQITEIEGIKATQAVGRLDTAQSPSDYRAALTELLDILKAAQERPVGWAQGASEGPSNAAPNFADMSDDELAAWIAENGG